MTKKEKSLECSLFIVLSFQLDGEHIKYFTFKRNNGVILKIHSLILKHNVQSRNERHFRSLTTNKCLHK